LRGELSRRAAACRLADPPRQVSRRRSSRPLPANHRAFRLTLAGLAQVPAGHPKELARALPTRPAEPSGHRHEFRRGCWQPFRL